MNRTFAPPKSATSICHHDGQRRDTVDRFSKYMTANPFYFRYVYGMEATPSNIKKAWQDGHGRKPLPMVRIPKGAPAEAPNPQIGQFGKLTKVLERHSPQATPAILPPGYRHICPNCKVPHKMSMRHCGLCSKYKDSPAMLAQIVASRAAGKIRRGPNGWRNAA